MMDLPKVKQKTKKRVGRGHGSGKGAHTVGRGQKGQKARRTIPILFEGYKVKKSLIKRLPFKRGKDKLNAHPKPMVINLEVLNLLNDGEEVTIDTLVKNGIVKESDAKKFGVKVLGGGKLVKKLTIALPASKSAAKKISEAGGKII